MVGYSNFCPAKLSAKKADWDMQLSTAVHEIGHALGFSSDHMSYFRAKDGTPLTARGVGVSFCHILIRRPRPSPGRATHYVNLYCKGSLPFRPDRIEVGVLLCLLGGEARGVGGEWRVAGGEWQAASSKGQGARGE